MVTLYHYERVVNAALVLNCDLLYAEVVVLLLLDAGSSITDRLELLNSSLLVGQELNHVTKWDLLSIEGVKLLEELFTLFIVNSNVHA
jgi:hypothetical protein